MGYGGLLFRLPYDYINQHDMSEEDFDELFFY